MESLTEELPCWAMLLSGAGIILLGLALRILADRRARERGIEGGIASTGDRTSYLLILGGIVWTGFGIVGCLG
jgi:hypothetical protein